MKDDIAEQLERLGKELLALAAEVKANAKVGADISLKEKLKQTELAQGALELLASLLPKETPYDDEADIEAAIALIRKTRRASVSHFQRKLGWGYNRAAKVIGLLQELGCVGQKVDPFSYEIFRLPKSS